MKVILSDKFQEHLPKFDDKKRQAVMDFVAYVSVNGLKNLAGRNKSSIPVNPHTKKQRENAKYAQKYCLWHYHIGIPEYVGEHGDMTSEYVLHYQRFNDRIVIVDLTTHPPFALPSLDNLKV
ncbi:hypothetical protein [Faucicola boevrei]|uniref:hypothetical protein n=1 Tax=Faucicola boevrei TaxID=346665 RepID=UPI00037B8954|nr:hypothetical protein [Moraxella boevrei]